MKKNKIFKIAILLVVLFTGSLVFAQTSELLRMDVKKTSEENTVEVVFYTTGTPADTVVSRKEGNKYIVLMPNVKGNQSIVPSLGGVKDLVSNVNVKSVDDGIGGYTKITFDAVKPLKIQTHSQKTAPLSKAQQDYKTLIAKNSIYDPNNKLDKAKQVKINTPEVKTTAKTAKVEPKQTQNKNNVVEKNKNVLESIIPKIKQSVVKPEEKKRDTVQVNIPIAKQNKDIPQKASKEEVKTLQTTSKKDAESVLETKKPPVEIAAAKSTPAKQPHKKIKSKIAEKNLPIIPIAGACSVFGIFLLAWIMNITIKAISNNSNKLKEYLENYNSEDNKQKNTDYNDILEKEDLNWQEKYKLYTERQEDKPQNETNSSYVADMSGSNGVIVSDDLEAKRSQMERALSKTPLQIPPETMQKGVRSEDDAIIRKMSGLNLKSFAKNVNLKKTNRYNVLSEPKKYQTKPLKEGRHVNLENSELTMSQRNISGHGFGISDLIKKGRRYLPEKRIALSKTNQQEQYSMSSPLEYLSLLDMDEHLKPVTNPVYTKRSDYQKNDSIAVVSRYYIDQNKSILMVNTEGVSSIIGKIGENVFVLKKFDRIINKPLQVRLDYDSVYIVKAGDFKCLVDVAEDKMGTLLEI